MTTESEGGKDQGPGTVYGNSKVWTNWCQQSDEQRRVPASYKTDNAFLTLRTFFIHLMMTLALYSRPIHSSASTSFSSTAMPTNPVCYQTQEKTNAGRRRRVIVADDVGVWSKLYT